MSDEVYEFTVTAVSSNLLAMTNCLFLSIDDYNNIIDSNLEYNYIKLADGFIYVIKADESVEDGEIAFNKLQRSASSINAGDNINSWIPPSNLKPITLTHLLLEVDLLGKTPCIIEEDALQECVKDKLSHHLFRKKQVFFLNFRGDALKISVSGVNVETFQSSYGFVVKNTAIKIQPASPMNINLTFNATKVIVNEPFKSNIIIPGLPISSNPTSGRQSINSKPAELFEIQSPDKSSELLSKLSDMENCVKVLRVLLNNPDSVGMAKKAALEGDLSLLRITMDQEEKKHKSKLDAEAKEYFANVEIEVQKKRDDANKEIEKLKADALKDIEKIKTDAASEIKKLKETALKEIADMKKAAEDDDGMALM